MRRARRSATRFAACRRGAIALDWLAISAGLAVFAALVAGVLVRFDLVDFDALGDAIAADAGRAVVAASGTERIDPGGQYAPGMPVFDPGGRDPGAVEAPEMTAGGAGADAEAGAPAVARPRGAGI